MFRVWPAALSSSIAVAARLYSVCLKSEFGRAPEKEEEKKPRGRWGRGGGGTAEGMV